MLSALMRLFGVDLARQFAGIEARIEGLRDRSLDKVSGQVKRTGLSIAFALSGVLLLLVTVAIGLIALCHFVALRYGDMVAFAVGGGATAAAALLMFVIAAIIGRRRAAKAPTRAPEPQSPRPAAPVSGPTPTVGDYLAALLPPARAAPILDAVVRRAAAEASATGEEAVQAASDMVRHGSRGAVVGTLAVTALVGWIIGRRAL